jgi:hypothetical protein
MIRIPLSNEPEHRLITGDIGSRPSRHGTLDRTIVWLIV